MPNRKNVDNPYSTVRILLSRISSKTDEEHLVLSKRFQDMPNKIRVILLNYFLEIKTFALCRTIRLWFL